MKTVTLYGASDDLIEVLVDTGNGEEEYNAEDAHFVLIGEENKQVRIRVWYTKRGMWAIAAAPVDEDIPMLPLSIDVAERWAEDPARKDGCGYSARAIVPEVISIVHEQANE